MEAAAAGGVAVAAVVEPETRVVSEAVTGLMEKARSSLVSVRNFCSALRRVFAELLSSPLPSWSSVFRVSPLDRAVAPALALALVRSREALFFSAVREAMTVVVAVDAPATSSWPSPL